jgi:glucose/arabinose dehydrogenase
MINLPRRAAVPLAVGLCLIATLSAAQTINDPNLRVVQVVSGLRAPTTMAFIGADDILVCQKNDGQVRRVLNGVLLSNPVLDLPVNYASERGLLGIALHPNFTTNGYVYLYFTLSSTGGDTQNSSQVRANVIVRFTWNGTSLTTPVLIMRLPVESGPNHDGGVILFGPDGKLYSVTGDLNRNGKEENYENGPAPDLTANILRMNDDGTAPPDNPFYGQSGLSRVYAYGVRNSFGMTFDPVTNVLWDSENGPDSYDEINRVAPGFNSGWEDIMGPDSRDPQGQADLWFAPGAVYSDPEFSWLQTVAPTAILFLSTSRFGSGYVNDCIVGDNNNSYLYHFEPNGSRDGFVFTDPNLFDLVADNAGELNSIIWGTGFGIPTDLKLRSDGLLYVVANGAGKIYRIEPRTGAQSSASPVREPAVTLVAARSSGAIRWRQTDDRAARVSVYDLQGRLVRTVQHSAVGAGEHSIAWDGRDDAGRSVADGIYLARIEVGGSAQTARLLQMR